MKFLKNNLKVIIAFAVGVTLTGGIVFAAGQYNASEVRYDTTTVAGSLDNLYNYAKNKSDLAEQMNKPNTWEVGTEYDFGNGIYGQRYTGTITVDGGNQIDTALTPISKLKGIISSGGYWIRDNNGAITEATTYIRKLLFISASCIFYRFKI